MKQLTKDGFLMYFNHEEGSIFNLAHKAVYQDMRQPLNHYFISSSHNTYLMEDQLKGPSSTEAYIKYERVSFKSKCYNTAFILISIISTYFVIFLPSQTVLVNLKQYRWFLY